MIDMHIHTINSDGENKTEEIIEMLKKQNIKTFSITDHDNITSCIEIEQIKLPSDMKYIKGVEFSSKLDNYKCHILGYDFDYKNQDINNICNDIKNQKRKKIISIIDNLSNKFGIELKDYEKQKIMNKKGTISRSDLYIILNQRGYGTRQEIYDKYLTPPEYIDHHKNIENIIKIIHKAGGKAILAHPKEIENDYQIDITEIIKKFLENELDGIEIYNYIHNLQDVKKYVNLAKKYNLLTTGGSDFHGQNIKPEIEIGYTTKQKIKIYPENINFHK